VRESLGLSNPKGVMKVNVELGFAEGRWAAFVASHSRGVSFTLREEAHLERTRWDPNWFRLGNEVTVACRGRWMASLKIRQNNNCQF